MKKDMDTTNKRKFDLSMHLVLLVLTGLLMFVFMNSFVKKIKQNDHLEIAFGITALFFGAIYTGRFLSQLWIPKNKQIPSRPLVLLPIVITAGIFFCARLSNGLIDHLGSFQVMILLFIFIITALASGMLIKLVRFKVEQQLQEAQASAAHSQGELHLLQSQLSPHFLFNTLNNMYGISITQHEKIPALLLKLSDLLRYSVYDTKEIFVPLKDEIIYINNYIDFEKIRLGDRLVLTTGLENIESSQGKIAPMLLIIFIENAFKHSKNTSEEKIFIEIGLKVWGDSILFSVKNSYQPQVLQNDLAGNTSSGFGLVNARKRLDLLYPGKYDLKTDMSNEFYSVMLRLTIQ